MSLLEVSFASFPAVLVSIGSGRTPDASIASYYIVYPSVNGATN